VTVPYGLGLMLGTYRGLDIVHHAGSVFGGACQMLTVPKHELDIVILTNGALAPPWDLAENVIDVVLSEKEIGPPQAKAVAQSFGSLIGKTYGSRSTGTIVKFEEAGGSIAASIFNHPPIPLVNDDGDLRLPFEKVVAGPFVFQTSRVERLDEEAPDALTMTEGGNPDQLVRLSAAPSKSKVASELVGDYFIPDLDAPATVRFADDKLELLVTGKAGHARYLLTPVGEDLFIWEFAIPTLPLRGALRVERAGEAVSALRLETLRTRGLLLVKKA
jgi:D-aminopeptidase